MLILILIDVPFLQNIVFRFEKGSNGQNHSCSPSHYPIKKSLLAENPPVTISKSIVWVIKNSVETH